MITTTNKTMVLNNDIPSTIPRIPGLLGNSPNLPIIPNIMKIKGILNEGSVL